MAEEILAQSNGRAPRVVIGHDTRHFSREFAVETALTFAAKGIKSMLFKQPTPVPLVSFSIIHHKCAGGIVITASHNPPNYNGYKVYWSDGTQVNPPVDQNIIRNFNNYKDSLSDPLPSLEKAIEEGWIEWIEGLYLKEIFCSSKKLLSQYGIVSRSG